MSEIGVKMIGSIFVNCEGVEVEIISWSYYFVGYKVIGGAKLFTSKNVFLKNFNPKDEE